MRVAAHLRVAVLCLAALPAVGLAIDALSGPLGANPYPTVIRETGLWSWRFLLIGLALSPASALGLRPDAVRWRRVIGLCAAFYAAAHLLAWAKDYGFDLGFLAAEIAVRPFLALGAASFVLLVPLVLTSTRRAARRLGGRGWRRLHALVYPAFAHDLLTGRLPRSPELLAEATAFAMLLGWRLASWRRYAAALSKKAGRFMGEQSGP